MNVTSGLFRLFYWPICRAYARFCVGDKPADALMRCLCILQFIKVHRFWPHFVEPRSFSEKLWSRMLYERDPLFTLISDKLRVREYVAAKVGSQYLIPMLWKGNKPEDIPFDELPAKFVIKTNHGAGYNIIVKDKKQMNQTMVQVKLRKWLAKNFCKDTYLGIAWGYKNINPGILIEPFMEENGKEPPDYKFYCFSGRVEFLTVHFDRFVEHKTRSFDRNFLPHMFRYDFDQWSGECQRPPNFENMVELAESLAEGFDFIRVDLYSVGGNFYFGELTAYPGGVSTKFLPASVDFALGAKWKNK